MDLSRDGRGLWPLRYSARELTALRVQARADARKIPQRWFWRYLEEEAAPHEDYAEEPVVFRRYAAPVGVHLFVDDSSVAKGAMRGVIESSGTANIEISRAECRRLGELFGTYDDHDALLPDEETRQVGPFDPVDPLFVPRAGDIFMYRRQHWRVSQMEPKKEATLGPSGIVMVWTGSAALLREDAAVPAIIRDELVPPTPDPVVPGGDVRWRR